MYSLPDELCGYGMGPLSINVRKRVPRHLRSGEYKSRIPDIVFPFAPVGINYEGNDHLDFDGMIEDVLAKMGKASVFDMHEVLKEDLKAIRAKVVDDMWRDRELAARGMVIVRAMKEDIYDFGCLDKLTAQILACARECFGVDTTELERRLNDSQKAHDRFDLLSTLLSLSGNGSDDAK